MNTLKGLILLLISSLFLFSCDEREIDTPSLGEPKSPVTANLTIREFIDQYKSVKDTLKVRSNDIIQGWVTANDISGNIYKQIVIQDETAALIISIDKDDMHADYNVGQKVVIECKDFYVGRTYNIFQMGAYYKSGTYNQVGRAPWLFVKDKIHLEGFHVVGGYIKPDTITVGNFDELKKEENIGKLYYLKGVEFNEGGNEPFADPDNALGGATNRQLNFTGNAANFLNVRTSTYASFAKNTLPEGEGAIQGILTWYLDNKNQNIQFLIPDYKDIHFAIGQGSGTENSPWSIEFALNNQSTNKYGWIQGYIVGTVGPSLSEITEIEWEAPFDMANTVVLALDPTVRDINQCVVVNLPGDVVNPSPMRTQVNLKDRPQNLHKILRVVGTLENNKDVGMAGLTVINGTTKEYKLETDPIVAGDGTKDKPYTVAQGIQYQGAAENNNFKWVTGYVVGIWETKDSNGNDLYPDNFAKFTPPFYTNLNLLLAATPNETSPANCLNVQIPIPMRDVLSPMNNADIFKQLVKIEGSLEKYNSMSGMKNLQSYEVEGITSPPPSGEGTGTEADPYNVAAAQSNQTSKTAWVKGYIVGGIIDDNNVTSTIDGPEDVVFGANVRATAVLIADSQTETDYTKCVAVNLPTGEIRNAVNLKDNPTNLGKELRISGVLRTYFGIAGVRDLTAYKLEGGNTLPNPDAILNETLLTQASFNKFTAVNVLGEQVWTFSAQYGATMSGFADNASHANEDWFISPAMNLTGKSNVTLTFDHARGPAGSMSVPTSNYTLWISTDYNSGAPTTATWTQLAIPTHGITAWLYVSSGEIIIPGGNANTRFAFKYVCNDTESATWEVKNVVVK